MAGTRVKTELKMKSNTVLICTLEALPAAGAMLNGSTPVCYALVLEAIKHNNAILESGKKYAYISI